MNVRYRVELSESERLELRGMLNGGEQAVRRLKRAQILLASDSGQREEVIATALGGCPYVVVNRISGFGGV